MDLTTVFPRSPRITVNGVAMVARTADKARADASGTLGAYTYACRMSRALFAFLGSDASNFKSATITSPDDAGVGRHVAECLASLKRTPHDVDAFNAHLLGVPDPENLAGFLEERAEVAPDRPDHWPSGFSGFGGDTALECDQSVRIKGVPVEELRCIGHCVHG